MHRRDFIKKSCSTCLGAFGAVSLAGLLQACAPLQILKCETTEGIITVPLTSFSNEQNVLIIDTQKMDYNIVLIREKDNTYRALYMQCTHQNQGLNATKNGLFCSAHGSAFDLKGNVMQEPATQPLKQFRTEVVQLSINIFINQAIK